MAISAVGTDGHTECTASGTAVTSALPTGITDGDLVFIEVSHGSGASNTTITTPSGWTLLTQPSPENSTRNPVFYRFFVSGDTAPSFTLGTSRLWCTHSTAFRGVDQTTPINASQGTSYASASSYTSASITPSVNNCMIVACWGGKVPSGATQTITVASGWTDTSGITQSAVAASVNQWDDFQYLLQSTAAAVSESVTVGSAQNASGYIIALAPASTGTQISLADAGAGADAVTVGADVQLSDVGIGADAVSVAASVPLAETGTATDAFSVAVPKPLTDAGTAADTFAVAATVPLAETGSAADTFAIAAAVPLTESGIGSDALTVSQAATPKPLTDAGAATDVLGVTAAVPLVELGAAADSLAASVLTGLAETATGSDAFSVQIVAPFTVGALTALDGSLSTLTGTVAGGVLAAQSGAATLTATDASTGALTATSTAGGPS